MLNFTEHEVLTATVALTSVGQCGKGTVETVKDYLILPLFVPSCCSHLIPPTGSTDNHSPFSHSNAFVAAVLLKKGTAAGIALTHSGSLFALM